MRDTTKLIGNESLRSARAHNESDDLSSALSIDSKGLDWPNRKKMQQLKKQRCKTNCYHILWVFLGLFLLIGSIQILWAPTMLENIVHDGITEAFVFTSPKPDDDNYAKWVTNDQGADSIPITVYIQFFNVTNPDDISNGELNMTDRIPKFNLTPPIVYNQFYYRENISFSDDGTMARSYFKNFYFHDPVLSEIDESENFTIIAPLVSGGVHWKDIDLFDPFIPNIDIPFAPSPEEIKEVVYEGFFQYLDSDAPDNLLTTANARDLIFDILDFKFPGEGGLNISIPVFGDYNIPEGRFIDFTYGMLKNGSGSWYVTHTGHNDEKRMGEVLKWSDQDQYFNGSEEELINFDSDKFTFIDCWYPNLPYSPSHFIYQGVWRIQEDVEDLPPFFVSTLKKPLIFDYYKSVSFRDIPAVQYNTSTGRQFMNESQYPPNAQYFQFGTAGVLNMTNCFNQLPLYFSLPHFYGAPDFAANNTLLGMRNPDPRMDNGYLMVEPMTGATLNAKVALQGNVPITPLPENYTDNITNPRSLIYLPDGIMAPTYLLTYEAQLPEAGAADLAKQINFANNLDSGFYIFGYICIGLGVLYWTFSMYWLGKNGYKKLFPGLCCCNNDLQKQIHDASQF